MERCSPSGGSEPAGEPASGAAPRDAEAELWQAYAADRSLERRNRLVELHLPLVDQVARRLAKRLPQSITVEELASAGALGLIAAVEAFEPARGLRFGTYAGHVIRGRMLDELRDLDHLSRLERQRVQRVEAAEQRHWAERGAPASDDELLAGDPSLAAGLPVRARAALDSLDRPQYDGELGRGPTLLRDGMADPRQADPARRLARLDVIRRVCRSLSQSERLLVLRYYWDGARQAEIGDDLGVSPSRVSQMHASLLGRLAERADLAETLAGR